MMYGGLMGSPLISRIMHDIDQEKVRDVFLYLQTLNP